MPSPNDDPPNQWRGGSPNDTNSDSNFDEWLEQTAENKDLSVHQLRHQLMSSYWILDEVARHLEKGTFEAESPAPEESRKTDLRQGELEGFVDLVESLKAFNSEPAQNAGHADKDDLELHRFLARLDAQLRNLSNHVVDIDHRVDARYAELGEQLEAVGEDAVRPVHLEVVGNAMRCRLSTLSDAVDAVETTVEEEVDRIDSVLAEHDDGFEHLGRHVSQQADQLDDLDAAIEDRDDEVEALRAQLSALESRVAEHEESLHAHSDAVSELRTSVEGHEKDLDAAHRVFQHVIDEVNRLDGRVEDIVTAVRNLEPAVNGHYDREQLADIKAEAARRDIWRAACESCGRTIKIDRLDRPSCPHCNESFGDLIRQRGWLRTKSILTCPDEPTRSTEPMGWADGLWPEDDENEAAETGFIWGAG